jgi:hypothetical protein
MAIIYIEKERVAHVRTTNTTTGAIAKNQFIMWGGIPAVADNNSAVGEALSLHIERLIELQVATSDLVEQTAKAGDILYLTPAGKFTKSSGTGDISYTPVGVVSSNDIANGGSLKFIKY